MASAVREFWGLYKQWRNNDLFNQFVSNVLAHIPQDNDQISWRCTIIDQYGIIRHRIEYNYRGNVVRLDLSFGCCKSCYKYTIIATTNHIHSGIVKGTFMFWTNKNVQCEYQIWVCDELVYHIVA